MRAATPGHESTETIDVAARLLALELMPSPPPCFICQPYLRRKFCRPDRRAQAEALRSYFPAQCLTKLPTRCRASCIRGAGISAAANFSAVKRVAARPTHREASTGATLQARRRTAAAVSFQRCRFRRARARHRAKSALPGLHDTGNAER